MTAALRIALVLIDIWVRVYTLGLAPAHRRDRIDLVQADVFEDRADMTAHGVSEYGQATALLGRCLRGAFDDIAWRVLDAPRRAPAERAFGVSEGRIAANVRNPGTRFFFSSAVTAWLGAIVLGAVGAPHSLAYAGGLMLSVALLAWATAVRASADDEAAPSVWPLLVAIGLVTVAAGLVFSGGRLGLLLLVPFAAGLSAAVVREAVLARQEAASSGLVPVSSTELDRRAAHGDAIALEVAARRGVSRRAVLRGGAIVGIASVLATMGGIVVDFLWQRNVSGFGGVVIAGRATDFPPGSKTIVREGKFWLVNLTAEQGGPGFLALWQRCPHLGCIVPYEAGYTRVDPDTGARKQGWFRCPCHQSTYNDAGVRVFGPAPRSMDRMALRINPDGFVEVDTGDIGRGAADNASFAVRAPEA